MAAMEQFAQSDSETLSFSSVPVPIRQSTPTVLLAYSCFYYITFVALLIAFFLCGITFDSAKFKGDTGGMDVAFKYLINKYYSRDMSTKTKSAKYTRMQRGGYQNKICPYGYRESADGRMEPDAEAAAVVEGAAVEGSIGSARNNRFGPASSAGRL